MQEVKTDLMSIGAGPGGAEFGIECEKNRA